MSDVLLEGKYFVELDGVPFLWLMKRGERTRHGKRRQEVIS